MPPKRMNAPWGSNGNLKTWTGVKGGKYHLIDTLPKWQEFYDNLIRQRIVACDLECNSLSYLHGKIIGFSFSWGAAHSYYVPVGHTKLIPDPSIPQEDWNPKKPKWVEVPIDEKQLKLELIREDLEAYFSDPDKTTIWHNGKFDTHFLMEEGFELNGIVHDTILMHKLVDENSSARLKDISKTIVDLNADIWEKKLDEWRTKFARKHKIKKNDVHYGLVPLDLMTPYAASDGHYTIALYKNHLPQIANNQDLLNLYAKIESKLLWVLLDMEHCGAVVDRDYLVKIGPEMQKEVDKLEPIIKDKLGDQEVNINSNKQVIPLLQKQGIKFYKKTKTGNVSLDAEVLENLASKHAVCRDLMNYRKLKKKISTYVDNILEKSEKDQKLHCEYNQNLVTGRLSSKAPSLMNLPRKDTTIRKAFVAPVELSCTNCGHNNLYSIALPSCPVCGAGSLEIDDDYFLCFIDLSQIEVRLTGHFSQDPILLDVYNNTGEDVHLRTCCEMFGYKYKEAAVILKDEKHSKHKDVKTRRQIAKMINFLIIYGGGAKNLSAQISTPEEPYSEAVCKKFIRMYFDKYKGIQRWIAQTKLLCVEQQGIQNYFGRWRRLPDLKYTASWSQISSKKWMIERAKRQGVNFVIQGSAADLFKMAMIRIHELLEDYKTKLVMPIHDEVVLYMHKSEMNLLPKITHRMEDFDFSVPIIAEVSYSPTSWAEKKELKAA
jgi:DNA polymerase-1